MMLQGWYNFPFVALSTDNSNPDAGINDLETSKNDSEVGKFVVFFNFQHICNSKKLQRWKGTEFVRLLYHELSEARSNMRYWDVLFACLDQFANVILLSVMFVTFL